jgi:hypothetical protein
MRRRPYLLGHGSRVDVDLTLRLQDEGVEYARRPMGFAWRAEFAGVILPRILGRCVRDR